MQLILFESISLNGMIGRPNGDGDFFTNYCWTGFVEVARDVGAIIWGRTTHSSFGEAIRAAAPELKGIVLTGNDRYNPGPGWSIAGSPVSAARMASDLGMERCLVVGGQTVNTSFAKAGLLDEIILFVESVAIGQGMPLFANEDFADIAVRLIDVSRPTDTVLQLHYAVVGQS